MQTPRRLAAVVTVGTELVEGLRVDTNTADVARRLTARGFNVLETVSVGDDADTLTRTLERLLTAHALVVVTGGLGPTVDDMTREAAAAALHRSLVRDAGIARVLLARRPDAPADIAEMMAKQADVLDGARVLPADAGTAPGQVIETTTATLVLLPGPPREMLPMLEGFLADIPASAVPPLMLSCVDVMESDVERAVASAVPQSDFEGIRLGLLAKPGVVEVILSDDGAGAERLSFVGAAVRVALGPAVFATNGDSLARVVLLACAAAGLTLATAESCTGGMVAAALTDVPGASEVLRGGIVAYADEVKRDVLGVESSVLTAHGAVSEPVAHAMAAGARLATGADIAVAITGIAGPDGGTPDKSVGTVYFSVSTPDTSVTFLRAMRGDRHMIRSRSTAVALDAVRRVVLGLPVG